MADPWIILLQSLYLLLPAGFANMSPVFFAKVNFLNRPVDFNKKLGGKRILGDHKTLRGLFFGIIVAIIIVFIQYLLQIRSISILEYTSTNVIIIGFLLGFGALFGDMVKSFFKRRMNIAPGKDWFFFDQLDWVIGSIVFIHIAYGVYTWTLFFVTIVLFFILHIIIKQVGYALKLDKKY